MTANNVLVFSSGVALCADTAVYNTAGVITGFCSKIFMEGDRRWGAVFSGSAEKAAFLCDAIAGVGLSFDEAARMLPQVFKEQFGEISGPKTSGAHVGLAMAGWSDETQGWRFGRVDTFEYDGCPPNTFNDADAGVMRPAPSLASGRALDDFEIQANLKALGLVGFATRLINAQRLVEVMDLGAGKQPCSVGGEGELVWIDHEGATKTTIAKWFDVVGEKHATRMARLSKEPRVDFSRTTRSERRRAVRTTRRAA